jgi:hypothetical protein
MFFDEAPHPKVSVARATPNEESLHNKNHGNPNHSYTKLSCQYATAQHKNTDQESEFLVNRLKIRLGNHSRQENPKKRKGGETN